MSSYFPTRVSGQQYVHRQETIDTTVPLPSDVCLEAEASPQGSKCLGLVVLIPRLGLNIMTSKLRYDIIIHKFHPFIFLFRPMCLRLLRQHFSYV